MRTMEIILRLATPLHIRYTTALILRTPYRPVRPLQIGVTATRTRKTNTHEELGILHRNGVRILLLQYGIISDRQQLGLFLVLWIWIWNFFWEEDRMATKLWVFSWRRRGETTEIFLSHFATYIYGRWDLCVRFTNLSRFTILGILVLLSFFQSILDKLYYYNFALQPTKIDIYTRE
ncbi:hypothetical protein F4777DRAFT_302200 [Nemania sp. FL0916]|nr:hypothetical protein F4777DRAFT_302200 [Nemania sp. FL0916]